jgi:hypothetical protein
VDPAVPHVIRSGQPGAVWLLTERLHHFIQGGVLFTIRFSGRKTDFHFGYP